MSTAPRPPDADAPTSAADADTRARAVRYARTRELLVLVDLLFGWLMALGWLLGGHSARLRDLAGRPSGGRAWARDGLYALLYGLAGVLSGLPLAYVRGYLVEHRFGLSTQTRAAWLGEQAKAAGLGLALQVPLTAGAYAVIRRSPRRWWLILSGLALPFSVLLAQLYPVLIAPLFNRFTPLADPALAGRVRDLAARAGVPVAAVTTMDMSRQTRKANAFFAGLGPTRRIALGDTLVEQFTPDEIEVIVAHELGHQVHRDIWKSVALGSLGTLGSAWLLARLAPPLARRGQARFGFAGIDDVASLPLLELLLGLLSVLLLPLANGFSRRWVERPADRYALRLTGRHDAFITGMEKLARLNLADPNPPALVRLLLYSHPPIAERIAEARRLRDAATD